MAQMTWKQFKEQVDKRMEEQGISEDVEIWYIDISAPEQDEDLNVTLDPSSGLAI